MCLTAAKPTRPSPHSFVHIPDSGSASDTQSHPQGRGTFDYDYSLIEIAFV